MKQLPKTVTIRGTGIKNLTAKLIKRKGHTVMYLRSDGYYEIGVIKTVHADYTFPSGIMVEKGDEYYWTNEEFGSIAKTTSSLKRAEVLFDQFLSSELK